MWRDAIQVPAVRAIGCTSDDEYISAFEQYVLEATAALSKHIQDPDLRNQISQSLHPLVDSIPAKFKLVSLDFTSNTYGLPVLTRNPLVLLANHFKRIPLALQEVGQCFSPVSWILMNVNERRSLAGWILWWIIKFRFRSHPILHTHKLP